MQGEEIRSNLSFDPRKPSIDPAKVKVHQESSSSESEGEDNVYDIREARCAAHRRKIGLRLQISTENVDHRQFEDRQKDLVKFYQTNFMMKECVRYAPKQSDPSKAPPRNHLTVSKPCHCGELLENHWQSLEESKTESHNRRKSSSMSTEDTVGVQKKSSVHRSPRSMVLTPRVTEQLLAQQSLQGQRSNSIKIKPNAVYPSSPRSPGRLPPIRIEHAESGQSASGGTSLMLPPTQSKPTKDDRQPIIFQETAMDVSGDKKGTSIGSPSGSPTRKKQEEPWKEEDSIKEVLTNAFGKLEFANDEARSKPAKYIRLSDLTPTEKVLELMVGKWRMTEPHRPSLAISVIGGAKNFNLDGKKKEIFSRGLVKAAQATNAWIITSGFNMGIMKTVGEAVRDAQTLQLTHTRVTHSLRCIGIGAWGYTHNRDDLISKNGEGCWPATYHVDPVIRTGRPVSLDPNHTHFILLDDGYRNSFRPNVADFRAKIERHIAAPSVSACMVDSESTSKSETVEMSGGLGIPVVLILVEGGLESIEFAYESLKCRIPLVICQGTGRAADIMSFAYNHHIVETNDDGEKIRILPLNQQQTLLEKLKAAYSKTLKGSKKFQEEKLEEKVQQILRCCHEEDLITVFDIHHNEEFDLAILSALLKGRGASRLDQLKLALKWNRSDVAAEKLFVDSAVWQYGELDDIMTEALATNKCDFVKLLLQHGVVMKDWLTVRRLRILYNYAGRGSFLRMLLDSASGGSSQYFLHHVKSVLERLMHRTVEDVYSLDQDEAIRFQQRDNLQDMTAFDEIMSPISEARFQKPFKELFLWAVLMNRHDLARFFWERGDHPVIGALVATKVCDSLAKMVQEANLDLLKQFKQEKKDFESLAISVTEHAFNADPEKAFLIVEQTNTQMGNTSCLQMASLANDKRFLATPCAQTCINQIWKRGLNCAGYEIILGCFVPFFIIFHCRFDASAIGVGRRELSWWQRLKIFYSAPITKFCSFTMFYVLFLLLYTFVLLFDFRLSWTLTEIVLHCWAATIMLNETRVWGKATYHYYATTDSYKRAGASLAAAFWTTSIWSKMELMALLFHLIGFGLRWLPAEYFDYTRVVFCLAVGLFYLRILRVYMASSYLGPKLFVIRRMFKDVVMFLMILIVFMMAYAVASQALMFPVREFYWGFLTDILYYPYWQIFGELSLDETIGGNMEGCEGNMTMNARGQYCPRKFWPVALMLAVYLLVGNILLVNLLIAIFTHVFEEVQANSTEIWKFELYSLATEFDHKPILPPPFTIVENIYSWLKWLLHKTQKKHDPHKHTIVLSKKQRENLMIFEKECMNEFLHSQKAAQSREIGHRVEQIFEKVDRMMKKLEEDRKHFLQLEALQSFTRTGSILPAGGRLHTMPSPESATNLSQTQSDFGSTLTSTARENFMKFQLAKKAEDIAVQTNIKTIEENESKNYHKYKDKRPKSSRREKKQNDVENELKQLEELQERLEKLEKKAEIINKK